MGTAAAEKPDMDALKALAQAVPDWQARLDDLKTQIVQRQIELAQLTDASRPQPARSIRNKGSTESLRRRDRDSSPSRSDEDEPHETALSAVPRVSVDAPNSLPQAVPPSAPFPGMKSGNLQTTPQRSISNPLLGAFPGSGTRKRKTASIASNSSGQPLQPKYRTRSMIIVYYDSYVQHAFENLVKFVSASRNNIRKAKMTMRMMELKRIAEMEAVNDSTDDDDDIRSNGDESILRSSTMRGLRPRRIVLELDENHDKAQFRNPRVMGPPAFDDTHCKAKLRPSESGHAERGQDDVNYVMDVFKELDKNLQWCQARCETAAHQFLRDGECDDEIRDVKKKLTEMKDMCEQELANAENKARATSRDMASKLEHQSAERQIRSIQLRKSPSPAKTPPLAGRTPAYVPMDLEVDDSDGEPEPVLQWVSARDRARV